MLRRAQQILDYRAGVTQQNPRTPGFLSIHAVNSSQPTQQDKLKCQVFNTKEEKPPKKIEQIKKITASSGQQIYLENCK